MTRAFILAVILALAPAVAQAQAEIFLLAGIGTAEGGVVEGDFQFFGVAATTPTKIDWLHFNVAGTYGTGSGPLGPVDLGAAAFDFEAHLGSHLRFGLGYHSGSAVFPDLASGELSLIGRDHGPHGLIAWKWERHGGGRIGLRWDRDTKAPTFAETLTFSVRWGPIVLSISKTRRDVGEDGEAQALSFVYPLG